MKVPVKMLQLIKNQSKKQIIVNNLYKELKVNDLMKSRLSIDDIEASELSLLKTCSKCLQSYNDIDTIISCGGWNDISCKKGSCEYWIHESIDCCQSEYDINYCSSCFTILKSLPNDNDTRLVNNAILRTASIDNDVIMEFNSDSPESASITQTSISDSYKSVFSKLNKINVSVNSCGNNNGSRPRSSGSPLIISVNEKKSTGI